jgi:hypothetical protein
MKLLSILRDFVDADHFLRKAKREIRRRIYAAMREEKDCVQVRASEFEINEYFFRACLEAWFDGYYIIRRSLDEYTISWKYEEPEQDKQN